MPLTVKQLSSDGTTRSGETFELTINDPQTNEPLSDVVFTCGVLSKAELRQVYRDHTTRVVDQVSRQMVPQVDHMAVADAICQTVVRSWTGVNGAGGEPLICTPETVVEIDDRIKGQIVQAVGGTEVTGRGPLSFRQSA